MTTIKETTMPPLRIMMKDPDTMEEALENYEYELASELMKELSLGRQEAEAVAKIRMVGVREFVEAYFTYGEYLAVDFDAGSQTATVRKKSEL